MIRTRGVWLLSAFIAGVGTSYGQCITGAQQPLLGGNSERTGSNPVGLLTAIRSGFEPNMGQVVTTTGQPAPFVRYRLSENSTNIFLLDVGIAYQFSRIHAPDGYLELQAKSYRTSEEERKLETMRAQLRLETYRMDMELEGADEHARISTEGRSTDYTNYYNHGALDVHTFSKVVYHDVYPGIDWSIRTTEKGFEYDFIVRPGADPALISLRFKDHEELALDDEGSLIHGNRLGRFDEERPVSFQDHVELETRFRLNGDLLTFEVGEYDHTRELTIDPPRLWGTYYGGTLDDYAQGVALDASGNVYMAGYTKSTSGIASPGAQDITWSAEDDAMLVKFNSDGVRQWGTYFGNADGDAFSYCTVDGNGNVFAGGITKSTGGVATAGAHQTTLGGDWDGLLAKFNADGVLQWATYYGGTGEERARSCAVDVSGNVYLTGLTESLENIATPQVHQQVSGGYQDAFLVKFNSGGIRQWGTYYGGSSDEQALGCATDSNGNVYIAGGTGTSTGTTIATAGSHQAVFGDGGADAFLAKFDPSGVRQWGTYYGGSSSDFGFGCAVDPNGNIFLAGDTYSTSGMATPGSHQATLGGAGDAFLVQFNTAGARQWATYYGGVAGDFGRGCHTDAVGNSYLVGETESTSGIASDNAYQPSFGGAPDDAYLVRFGSSGVRDFGTYYGGSARDNGYNCAVDNTGNIYLVGEALSDNAISASGHQNTRGGGFDAFLVKFGDPLDCLNIPGGTALPGTSCNTDPCITGGIWNANCVCIGTAVPGPSITNATSSGPICEGSTLSLFASATGTGTITFGWTGPNNFTSTDQNPSITNATVAATGTYTVTASNGCGTNATGTTSATVLAGLVPIVSIVADPSGAICAGTSVTFTATAGILGGGIVSSYDFRLNGTSVQNTAGNTFTSSSLANGDQMSCTITVTGGACLFSTTASSNMITTSVSSLDTDGDGTPDCADNCPNVVGQIGSPCDDGNDGTIDDQITTTCICAGTAVSCLVSGDCNDNDPCTSDSCVDTTCVYTALPDSDGDGLCDALDGCPNTSGEVGDPCDDANDCTIDDVLAADCICTGMPVQISAITGEALVIGDGTYTYIIDPVPGATAYAWDIPSGWSSGNTTNPTLNAFVGSMAGGVQLCVTVFLSSCALDTCMEVQVIAIGIDDAGMNAEHLFSARPNPSAEIFIIQGPDQTPSAFVTHVTDALGRFIPIRTERIATNATLVDLAGARPGTYYLHVAIDGAKEVVKLMLIP